MLRFLQCVECVECVDCVDYIFEKEDYKSKYIQLSMVESHNQSDNAWIRIGNVVYSIQKENHYLLDFFKDYYGKDVKDYLLQIDKKIRNNIFVLLKERKIGIITIQ